MARPERSPKPRAPAGDHVVRRGFQKYRGAGVEILGGMFRVEEGVRGEIDAAIDAGGEGVGDADMRAS